MDRPLIVYATTEAHSSIQKSISLAGFGQQYIIRWIDVDEDSRQMNVDHLQQMIESDIENDCLPCSIVASSGTTGVTAFDPIEKICHITKDHEIWVHVDAAMAGSAMLIPECRHLWRGIELSDSLSWNPHKWMGTNLDCSLFYVKDYQHLIRVMSTNLSYLRSAVDAQVTQYRDWGIALGRRFRALKLLFHLRLDGIESIRYRLRRDMQNAQWLAARVKQTDNWELMFPLCIRHHPPGMTQQQINQYILRWVNVIN